MRRDLTQLEIPRLPEILNLTDGHAHRSPNKAEQRIVDHLSDIYTSVQREQQPEIEDGYLTAFYGLTKQSFDKQKTRYFLLSNASMSLELVANYLRLNKYDLSFMEPCFDNLANIFERHNIALEPLPDRYMELEEWGGVLDTLKGTAICIVSPNNPTGVAYSKKNFEYLVNHCKRYKKMLVLDTCFRAYRPADTIFDEYQILQDSGIDYIVVEDTGKTWPTKELKVSVLAVSPRIYQAIYDIYSDFLLLHSPFIIKLLTEFIANSADDGLHSVHDLVGTNRKVLRQALEGTCLESIEKPYASVAWLEIKNGMSSTKIAEHLSKGGLYVLPGNHFFWSDKSQGDRFIRMALVRDPETFQVAADRLRVSLAGL